MTQAKKKILRRKIAQALNHQMKTVELLIYIATTFGEFHADYEEIFELIANNCMLTIEWIKSIAIKAWGYIPDDINTWLK